MLRVLVMAALSCQLIVLFATFYMDDWSSALANHTRALIEDFGLETAFLTQLVEEREEMCFADSIDPADPIAVHGCTVRLKVWREDLNKDGAYELLVLVRQLDHCGSAGCELNLYEKRFGEWTLLTNGSAFVRPEVYDDPANDWPILIFFGFSGRIWKKTDRGGEYVRFCVSDSCRFFMAEIVDRVLS